MTQQDRSQQNPAQQGSVQTENGADDQVQEPGPLGRRSLLKGIAIAGVAVPVLAACGSKGSADSPNGLKQPAGSGSGTTPTTGGTPSTGSSTTPSTGSSGGSGADVLVAASQVPVGGGVILTGPNTVVTQPTKGTFEGFSATCTHMGCTVYKVTDGRIICPCHGSMYSVTTGDVLSGPAPRPLPKKPVKLDGANIVAG
jgi:nitrite reductase/ring-hydroxylating ferredoxin subunit